MTTTNNQTIGANTIVYCSFDSPLGPMIAGATDSGICLLEWHDRGGVPRILERAQKRYRLSTNEGTHPLLDQLQAELAEYFDGRRKQFDVPVAPHGTPFERRVWALLLAIPWGRQRTYGDLARDLGKPGAPRAVGRANGANQISILLPCHRVVEAGGGLRGYGGGLWRKRRLLEIESGQQSVAS